jgi:hypothetical protein
MYPVYNLNDVLVIGGSWNGFMRPHLNPPLRGEEKFGASLKDGRRIWGIPKRWEENLGHP